VRALGAKVRFQDDARMTVDEARVRIRFADGFEWEERIDAARGSLQRPMSDAELEQKLRDLCEYSGARIQVPALVDALWRLDRTPDAGSAMALAAPSS